MQDIQSDNGIENIRARKAAIASLMTQIREAASADAIGAGGFLQELQGQLEYEPGAYVAFTVRDVTWLDQTRRDKPLPSGCIGGGAAGERRLQSGRSCART